MLNVIIFFLPITYTYLDKTLKLKDSLSWRVVSCLIFDHFLVRFIEGSLDFAVCIFLGGLNLGSFLA